MREEFTVDNLSLAVITLRPGISLRHFLLYPILRKSLDHLTPREAGGRGIIRKGKVGKSGEGELFIS